MSDLVPAKEWWTAEEIAASGLPDMPTTRKGIEKLVLREEWRASIYARRREGRGGGWEYNWQLLPIRARRKLLSEVASKVAVPKPTKARSEVWDWYERLPAHVRAVAEERLNLIQRVEALTARGGVTKVAAMALVANETDHSYRSIVRWNQMVLDVPREDRLPYLAPRNRAAPPREKKVQVDPAFMTQLKSDFLRPAAPAFAASYRRTRDALAGKVEVPPEHIARRRLFAEVSKFTLTLYREGEDALKAMYPPQKRARWELRPMEVVVADFHRWDVFVEWPQPYGRNEPPVICRPQMVAFQDVASNKILSWRYDQTPNSTAVALAAGDMIEAFGIPEHVLFDNGREFAAKSLTGGTSTRYRFKVREDDVPGLFVQLGCEMHWATPYSGQSKPIERAFRDMCNDIAKDPRFDGAYTGNSPMAKPEDYGNRAIPLAEFIRVVDAGIAEYNSRPDRRSEVAFGRSFDDVFAEGYATAPIRKATEAQRRLWLLGQEELRGNAKTGMLTFEGNEYWAEWMVEACAGEPVVARFDPQDYFDGLHVYSRAGEYLGHAPIKKAAGFLNADEGRAHARARRDFVNRAKALAKAERKLTAIEVGREIDAAQTPAPMVPEARVVRPTFGAPKVSRAAPAAAAPTAEQKAIHEAVVADLTSRLPQPTVAETAREKFKRALELEARLKAGDELTPDQRRWLQSYQQTSEYRGELALFQRFGSDMFG